MLDEMELLAVVGQARSSLRTALSLSLSGLPSVAVKPRPSVRPLPEMRLVVELVNLRCFVVKVNQRLCSGMMSRGRRPSQLC